MIATSGDQVHRGDKLVPLGDRLDTIEASIAGLRRDLFRIAVGLSGVLVVHMLGLDSGGVIDAIGRVITHLP